MIERSHLQSLLAIHQLGSVTAAADSLCLTQSALSHSLRKLEDRFGIQLWRREGRRLALTPAGEYLLSVAQRLVPQFNQIEERLTQIAAGRRGALRIGMECHPCYRWLQGKIEPFLSRWPDVDLDVKQKFQFGGMAALFEYEIDVLVTPDPLFKAGLHFRRVFDYEQVLVVGLNHVFSSRRFIHPSELSDQILATYPIPPERLDIYTQFLHPAGFSPRQHLHVEDTDVLLQLVACGRAVAAMPKWLVKEYAQKLPIKSVRLGPKGVHKAIHLGVRSPDLNLDYMADFLTLSELPI